MPEFKDIKGQAWPVPKCTFGVLLRVESDLGLDCMQDKPKAKDEKPTEDELNNWWLVRLYNETKLFGALLCFLFKNELEKKNLSNEDFADLFDHDCFNDARIAVIQEILSFTKSPAIAAAAVKSLSGAWEKIDAAAIPSLLNNTAGN